MTFQNLPDYGKVIQVFPEKKQVLLEGLYLSQQLAEMAAKIGRPLVVTDFLTDRNGVIAKADENHVFRVPLELRNASDWRLFQELMAQADVIISGQAYLKRISLPGNTGEDVLSQYEPGKAFEKLGDWRLSACYKNRSPDVAIVSRSLDFKVPESVFGSGRMITVFTTDALARSEQARSLTASGLIVVGSGEAGVDGKRMIDTLGLGMDYRVIMMATGPSVLGLLLEADRLDLFYVTEAQLEIPFNDPSALQRMLPDGKKVDQLDGFGIVHRYLQENVLTEDGSQISQLFLRYDRKGALEDGSHRSGKEPA